MLEEQHMFVFLRISYPIKSNEKVSVEQRNRDVFVELQKEQQTSTML